MPSVCGNRKFITKKKKTCIYNSDGGSGYKAYKHSSFFSFVFKEIVKKKNHDRSSIDKSTK